MCNGKRRAMRGKSALKTRSDGEQGAIRPSKTANIERA